MKKWNESLLGNISTVTNEGGLTLAYSTTSGVQILEEDGFAFKDLNKDGKLDKYEDWRLSPHERAKDLATKMSIEQIAGLMLYSSHQMIPPVKSIFGPVTYNGKSYKESGAKPSDLSDQQLDFLKDDHLRHVLVTVIQDTETGASWNNNLQAYVESLDLGIPANNSSDPRHGIDKTKEFNLGGGVSSWPGQMGLAATFSPEIVREFGYIAAKEYRALGIATALSPQVDLATEPRWGRFKGTFGEDVQLSTDMAKAYCDGFQTSPGSDTGWGVESVNAMVKHWPGGGSGEGGRDGHFNYGKYAVYPGNNFEEHLKPFLHGAFNLSEGTSQASAVMPYYTISYDVDKQYNENVGNSFSKYIITDLLRDKYNYDGVVCTDWHITSNSGPEIKTFSGKCWGTETLSEAMRHYKVLMAGVDQFGGNNKLQPILDAYAIGVKEHGESFMRKRFEQSARRLLKNIFRVGLFENPYLVVEESKATVMNDEFMDAGYMAQLKSLVMLKNRNNTLPLTKGLKVYIPERYSPAKTNWFDHVIPARTEAAAEIDVISDYFNVVSPDSADVAIVFVRGPLNLMVKGGYDSKDLDEGGNGYLPINLQYRPYTAETARKESIAGGDPLEAFTNRSYQGKTVKTYNEQDLDDILNAKELMGDKPVIVVLQLDNPAVVKEFESLVDGLIVDFGTSTKAICEVISGDFEPSGLLPLQMPEDMLTVETQLEDVPHDMRCHRDSEGHVYDFGFGLNYKGIIKDERTQKYLS